ncbi:zinc-binding dehydrogenase [Streptococcus sp. zg-JUN1979]|uniref:zinc-binding dehydrogenase n=1 Tax=Streptococcus sp. zg-JUN1979 TaxID=3391450 RepID=UPI0039B0BC55
MCSTGQLGGQWYLEEFDPIIALGKGVYLTSFYSGNVEHGKLQDLFDYIKRHQVQVKSARLFYLHDIQEAHRYLESQEAFGKVVVITDK